MFSRTVRHRLDTQYLRWLAPASVAFVVLLALPLPAAGVASDAEQPANILADNCTYDHAKEFSVCTGSVEIHQGTLRVDADRVRVTYKDKKVHRLTAEGSPAHYQQQLEPGKGEVKADARTIVYYTAEERVEFVGDAFLRQEGNDIQGELIRYDMIAGRVTATPEKDGRVNMTIQPATLQND